MRERGGDLQAGSQGLSSVVVAAGRPEHPIPPTVTRRIACCCRCRCVVFVAASQRSGDAVRQLHDPGSGHPLRFPVPLALPPKNLAGDPARFAAPLRGGWWWRCWHADCTLPTFLANVGGVVKLGGSLSSNRHSPRPADAGEVAKLDRSLKPAGTRRVFDMSSQRWGSRRRLLGHSQ